MRKEMHTYTYKPPTNAASPFAQMHTHFLCRPQETPSRHDSTNIAEEKPIWQHLYIPQGQAQRTLSKIRGHDVKMFSRTHPHTYREPYDYIAHSKIYTVHCFIVSHNILKTVRLRTFYKQNH